MGLEVSGIGVIAFVCSGCSARLYWYVIGDGPHGNRNKFSGPPTPERALSGYGGECPVCGRRLSLRPLRIEIHTVQEFNDRYIVTDYQVIERSSLMEGVGVAAHTALADEAVGADNA